MGVRDWREERKAWREERDSVRSLRSLEARFLIKGICCASCAETAAEAAIAMDGEGGIDVFRQMKMNCKMLQQFLCFYFNRWARLGGGEKKWLVEKRCSAERRPSSINFAWALEKIEVKLR